MKIDREKLRNMFGGRCAYCGRELPERFHADHVKPIHRRVFWKGLESPEHNNIENIYPACPPCNRYKASMPLEGWRKCIENLPNVLKRDCGAFRHAERFGLVNIDRKPVKFYFEILRDGE